MKVNHKTLISALFALLIFSVAVSGGCGGGSGNSVSQDAITIPEGFTIEYASPDLTLSSHDVISSDDLFVSGDANAEYGDGEIDNFTLLTKTTWNIQSITVRANNGTVCKVQGDNSYDTKTVTFLTSNRALAWAHDENKGKPVYEDLTVEFKDPRGNKRTAPILRAGNFTDINDHTFQASIGAGTEQILLNMLPGAKTPKNITVQNTFSVRGTAYTCTLELSRVDNFLILDQTVWMIKDMQVFGIVKDANGNYVYGDPKNYVITSDLYKYHQPITLLTSVSNDGRYFLEYKRIGPLLPNYLDLPFKDKTLNLRFYAPYLRKGGGFYSKGFQGDYEVFEAALKDHDYPGNEVVCVTDYGPNSYILIENSVCYKNEDDPNNPRHYWVRMTLKPSF